MKAHLVLWSVPILTDWVHMNLSLLQEKSLIQHLLNVLIIPPNLYARKLMLEKVFESTKEGKLTTQVVSLRLMTVVVHGSIERAQHRQNVD